MLQVVSIIFAVLMPFASTHGDILSNCRQVLDAYSRRQTGEEFNLSGTVVLHSNNPDGRLLLTDETHAILSVRNFTKISSADFRFGDRIHILGSIATVTISNHTQPDNYVVCTNLTLISRGNTPPSRSFTVKELTQLGANNILIQTEGTIVDACADDIHAQWASMILEDDGARIRVAVERRADETFDFSRIIGARVSIIGIFSAGSASFHKTLKKVISIDSTDMIRVCALPPSIENMTAMDVEKFDFADLNRTPPTLLHSTSGQVLATWGGNNLMLRTESGRLVKGELSQQVPLPKSGQGIRLFGYLETDLYTPILIRANWKDCRQTLVSTNQTPATDITQLELCTDDHGGRQFNFRFHGREVRMKGKICGMPTAGNERILYLESGGKITPVDISSLPSPPADLQTGSVVQICGLCIMDTEKIGVNGIFPRINGYRIVIRAPNDIRIIANPPWWTPAKSLMLISALLVAITAILVWNKSLRVLAERRGRELLREQLGHARSSFKTIERTRLAVELHDSLSQSLTGASMELEAAEGLKGDAPREMLEHVGLAAKTIASCREELKNCLWDLRSQSLDEPDMTTAIHRTLLPHVNDSQLIVRFNVPRSHLSDNTAHAILRIVRELVVNAIRHGNAGEIKIAGSMTAGLVLFSVKDNGCGFDPDNHPGVLDGHFGLQGIRERVKQFGGTVSIDSSRGQGTKVCVRMKTSPVPNDQSECSL